MFLFTWFFLDTFLQSTFLDSYKARFFIFQNNHLVSKKTDIFYKNTLSTYQDLA